MTDPAVSIILPTYNRARFLPGAFESIRGQRFGDWELIVVDDGSTDETRELVEAFAAEIEQPVQYIWQENQGAYGARNTGLDHATGKYIAFYDSDDLWLPHHLADCVEALDANPDVDWVYGACRIVDHTTGKELAPSTFYVHGRPRPFLKLRTRDSGNVRIIEDDSAIVCMLTHGLYNGLQNSVIRRRVFDRVRFEAESRNEAEDQLVVIRILAERRRLAFLDAVHVTYRVHESNSSGSAQAANLEKRLRVQQILLDRFERLPEEVQLTATERRALRRRLSRECFWLLGYALLWEHGRRVEAIRMFRRGMRFWPWDWRYWKTFLVCWIRVYGMPTRATRLSAQS